MKELTKAATVRRMTEADVKAVYEIEMASFKTPWSMESFEKEIRENQLAVYFVVEVVGEVVGYAGMWTVMDELHITNVAVMPSHRGKGLSSCLMDKLFEFAAMKHFKSMTLEVRTANSVAIGLYEKFGFVGMGIRKGYYQDTNEDALIMWKEF